jgi:uncharacterized spore protein YtfJ
MNVSELLQTLSDRAGATATVKNVYGEPITFGNRTVIPAARVRYGFGAGGGEERGHKEGKGGEEKGHKEGHGGGGGVGVVASPCGAIEITAEGTRFIEFHPNQTIALAIAAGFLLGSVTAWLRGR